TMVTIFRMLAKKKGDANFPTRPMNAIMSQAMVHI
ncbi:MAG: hypothetical protein ACI90V_003954, partial [Bacillariaceae sp.]